MRPLKRLARGALVLGGLCLAACTTLQPPLSHDELVRSELATIIALKGLPCGSVVAYWLDDRLDYRSTCESGHSYRIQVTAEGRVEATGR
jgi:hypothetical protein